MATTYPARPDRSDPNYWHKLSTWVYNRTRARPDRHPSPERFADIQHMLKFTLALAQRLDEYEQSEGDSAQERGQRMGIIDDMWASVQERFGFYGLVGARVDEAERAYWAEALALYRMLGRRVEELVRGA